MDNTQTEAALRGIIGVMVFVAMFAAARFRFRVKEQVRGPADRGLD